MSETPASVLTRVVRERMTGASEESIAVVVAMAGVLAQVAFADRRYTEPERVRVEEELSQVLGFDAQDVQAVSAALAEHMDLLSDEPFDHHAEVLRTHLDKAMRAEAVHVLVDLAAADDELTDDEERVIRGVARSLWVDEALLEALLLRARKKLQES
ncbi:MAG: TerB family tellurite resistance protein [Myxococcales bacterium]|jgi:uncharacterized tellurite resistance protein B-like protein